MEKSVLFYVAFKTTTTFKEDVRNSGTSFEVHLLNITSGDLSLFIVFKDLVSMFIFGV